VAGFMLFSLHFSMIAYNKSRSTVHSIAVRTHL
jgi:hypothetical protein